MKNLFAVSVFFCFCCAVVQAARSDSSTAGMRLKYPDADTVCISSGERVRYEIDGSAESEETFSVRILTEKGKRSLRKRSWSFDSNYETMELRALAVVKADGSKKVYPPERYSHTSIDSESAGSNIFSRNIKVLTLSLPDLEVGDTVDMTVRYRLFKPRMAGQWSHYGVLQSDMPIEKSIFTVDAPAELPLKSIVLKDELPGCVKSGKKVSGDRIIYTWTAENVPQLIAEDFMPPMYACSQRILISTVGRWEDVSRWYAELCEPHLRVDDAIKKKVADLISGVKGDEEKINALFRFVAGKIRYIGLADEKSAPGYEPHDVTRTFERGNGVCRDKAALLVAMLRTAGFKAFPVLFMAGYRKDGEVPNMYFNHAICAVESSPGKYLLMDPTDETALELLPAYLANCSYLVARSEGDTLRCTPSVAAGKNMLRINSDFAIDENNELSGVVRMDFSGIYDNYYRSFLATHYNECREYFLRMIRRKIPGAEMEKIKFTPDDMQNTSEVLCLEMAVRAKDITAAHSAPQMLVLPEFAGLFGFTGGLYRAARLEKRAFPLLAQTRAVKEEITLKLPEKLKIRSLPAEIKAVREGIMRMERSVKQNGNTLKIKRLLAVDSAEISKEQYKFFRTTLQKFDRVSGELPVATAKFDGLDGKSFPGEGSILLDEEREIILDKNGSWSDVVTVRRKILNYSGAYRNSTLKELFVPGFEELSVSGYTISPDGKKRELKPNEINVIDAPWNSEVKRYPAGKILTAAFPAVVPGSVICYTLKKEVSGRKLFSARMLSRGSEPAQHRKLCVRYPAERNLRVTQEGLNFTVSRTLDSEHRKVVCAENFNQLHLPEESSVPPLEEFTSVFTVSDRNYRGFADALNGELRKVVAASVGKVRKIAAEITDGEVSEIGKIRKIHKFITANIRQAGPDMNVVPWSAFSTADVTLKSGAGNSADTALLYAAFCEALGIEWRFVAVSDITAAKMTENYFSHYPRDIFGKLLVFIPACGIYLNDNGLYGVVGAVRSENLLALELQSGHLLSVLPQRKFLTAGETECRIKIDNSGDAVIRMEHTLYGNKFEEENGRFAAFTPETRRRHFEGLAAQISRSAEFVEGSADFKNYPGKITYKVKIPAFVNPAGSYTMFELPDFEKFRRAVELDTPRRQLPFLRRNEVSLENEYIIEYPENFRVSRMRDSRREVGRRYGAFYQETVVAGKNTISINCRLHLPAESIPPEEYGAVLQLNKLFNQPGTAGILLRRAEEKK